MCVSCVCHVCVCHVLFIFYDLLLLPLQVFNLPPLVLLDVLQAVCALFWSLDIVMSFRTGIFDGAVVQMSAVEVAKRYCRTWLAFDCTVVAVDWAMLLGVSHFSLVIVRLCRVCRVLRIAELSFASLLSRMINFER